MSGCCAKRFFSSLVMICSKTEFRETFFLDNFSRYSKIAFLVDGRFMHIRSHNYIDLYIETYRSLKCEHHIVCFIGYSL